MKAAVRTRYGPPNVVQIQDVAAPEPKDDEILVRIHATTVNRTDCGFRAGKPFVVRFLSGLPQPRRTILGLEFAGTVESAGRNVGSFKQGDRVFGFNEFKFGAHAEYLAINENGPVAAMPAGKSFEEVAPSTEGSHYAYWIIKRTKIAPGQRVLVYGATGAIGTAAVQILKSMDVTVTAVTNTKNVELTRGLGADKIIDYERDDFAEDTDIYDVVIDAVGKISIGRCRRLLKPRGIYASSDLGPLNQNAILGLVTPLLPSRKAMLPIPGKHTKAEVTYFKEMMEAGTFKPVIDRRYPLDQIVDAYRYVETGQKTGNVVITVASA